MLFVMHCTAHDIFLIILFTWFKSLVPLNFISSEYTGFIALLAPFPSLDATWVICLGIAISSPCHLKYQCQAVAGQARPGHMVSPWLKAWQQSCFGWSIQKMKTPSPHAKPLGLPTYIQGFFWCVILNTFQIFLGVFFILVALLFTIALFISK